MKIFLFLRGDGGKTKVTWGLRLLPARPYLLISASVSNGSLSEPIKMNNSFLSFKGNHSTKNTCVLVKYLVQALYEPSTLKEGKVFEPSTPFNP